MLLHAADRWSQLEGLLARYALKLVPVADGDAIPGSYWGGSEAGLRGEQVFARRDTPVHSVLHETSHVICMTPQRRALLDTDAGGGYDEENSVCVLQILLASDLYCEREVPPVRIWIDGVTHSALAARGLFLSAMPTNHVRG